MTYKVEFDHSASKELMALPAIVRERIIGALRKLARDPFAASGVKSLKGGLFRLRVGDYRIVYSIKTDVLVVLVVKVGHRREVYRD